MGQPFLREDQFERMYALLRQERKIHTKVRARERRFLEAVCWINRGGAQWRFLPNEYGGWNGVYKRFARWGDLGVWERLLAGVADDPDRQAVLIDATVVRAHACAAGAPKKNGGQAAQALGRSRGGFSTKLHILADALGNPLRIILTGGAAGDNPQAIPLLDGGRAGEVVADRGYDADKTLAHIAGTMGAVATIPPKRSRVARLRLRRLQGAASHRVPDRQTQALPPHLHPLRQVRPPLPRLRPLRLHAPLAQVISSTEPSTVRATRLFKMKRRVGSTETHVVFVLEFFYPHVGGLETLFQQLTEGLAKHGYRVTVVTLWLPGTRRRERHNGVDIVRVKTPGFAQRYLFMLFSIPTVLREARAADLIHTTTYNAALPSWFASLVTRRPATITVHEVFAKQWQQLPGLNPLLGYVFRLFEWGILHLPFAHYICDSEFTARRLRQQMGVPEEKVSTVYPAVDYDFWDRARHERRVLSDEAPGIADGPVYLYFGRAGLSKGLDYLIEAARIIRRARPDSHGLFLLARDPRAPYRRALRQIAAYSLAEHLIVLDPVPRAELPGYLLAADCVVVPSISEGFGYAAVEAATLGCPVVATTGHSVEEVLADGVRFVAPRDPIALAQATLDIMQDRPEWREPERYDIRRHIVGIEAVYERIGIVVNAQQKAR